MSKVTFGSDPELFIYDTEKKVARNALNVIKKEKNDPIRLNHGVYVYADNALIEAKMDPQPSSYQFLDGIRTLIIEMAEYVHGLNPKYALMARSAMDIQADDLMDKRAWEIGCNPSTNAYTGAHNKLEPFRNGLRTGSFHIHIGSSMLETMDQCRLMVQLLDIVLGCPSVIFDIDTSTAARRKYYGKAGEFRPTPYGLEYRVLGNWALNSPEIVKLICDLVDHAMSIMEIGYAEEITTEINEQHVKDAINHCDVKMARQIVAASTAFNRGLEIRITDPVEVPKDDIYLTWLNANL